MAQNDKSDLSKKIKFLGVEFSLRVLLVGITFVAVLYMAAANWDWYVNDLGGTVKHPKWASPLSNWVLWIVWFLISAFSWHRHQIKHKQVVKMDLVYPSLLVMVFITFTLFFEQRHLGAAKWAGVIAVVINSYILYEGFVTDGIVTSLMTCNYAILLYTVAQIWHASRNIKKTKNNWSDKHTSSTAGTAVSSATCSNSNLPWYS